MKLSVCLITKNEENNIEACLQSVSSWADEIVVIDSSSTDRTVSLAKAAGAIIFDLPFRDYSSQKNAAVEKAAGDWIFFIDADERATQELGLEIQNIVRNKNPDAVYGVKRLSYFLKKPLRYSGTQEDRPVRLFPRGQARFEQPVHEYIATALPVKQLHHPLIHHTTQTLDQYFAKLERYTGLELRTMEEQGRKASPVDFILAPPAKFFYLYLWKLGILDRGAGFMFSILSAYYHFQKYWKLYRRQHA